MRPIERLIAEEETMSIGGNSGKSDLEKRLEVLHIELAKGQRHLTLLDRQRQDVRDTLLRITGAIQVLEELLQQEERNGADGRAVPDDRAKRAESVTSSQV